MVITYKMISYEYFMDDLTDWELELLMSHIDYSYKNEWEMTRLQMYSNMIPYMKKGSNKTPKDILPLPTDDDYKQDDPVDVNITDNQIETMRKISKNLSKQLNG